MHNKVQYSRVEPVSAMVGFARLGTYRVLAGKHKHENSRPTAGDMTHTSSVVSVRGPAAALWVAFSAILSALSRSCTHFVEVKYALGLDREQVGPAQALLAVGAHLSRQAASPP